MKYLYCLVRGEGECHGFPTGVDGMAIHPIRVEEMSALVSDVNPSGGSRSVENALAHHEVVSQALACFPAVLPCRFGTVVADERGVVALLTARYPRLEGYLDRFQGKVEAGIKAILDGGGLHAHEPWGGGAREGRTPAERYLFEKRARFRRAEALEAQAERLTHALQEATSPVVEAVKAERKPFGEGLIVTLCCLLERTNLAPFRQGYEQVRRGYPQVRFLYTGPWPPYSFADMDLTAAEHPRDQ